MIKKLALIGCSGLALTGIACNSAPQADTDTPVVFITYPKADSTVGGQVSFAAQVYDGFGVAKVVFTVDGVVIGEDLTEPWGVLWTTVGSGNGPHALRVQATDPAGNTGFKSISVTVDNSRQ